MAPAGALAVAGALVLLAGALVAAARCSPRSGLAVQALGAVCLGAAGVWVLASGHVVGSGFHGGVRPAFGLDGLSGFFLLVVALTYLIDRGGSKRYALAVALFILGGAVVEYLWMGVLCCLGAWLFCRKASLPRLLLWILGTLSLTIINSNTWALAALPIVLMAGRMPHHLSRQTWLFYGFYPAHLLLLLFIRLAWF